VENPLIVAGLLGVLLGGRLNWVIAALKALEHL
jgi:hypothetical protein